MSFTDIITITANVQKLIDQILIENPRLKEILNTSKTEDQVLSRIKEWMLECTKTVPEIWLYYKNVRPVYTITTQLKWKDYATIRILDYIEYADKEYIDLNRKAKNITINPFKTLWQAVINRETDANAWFFEDMLYLFRQFNENLIDIKPTKKKLRKWMHRFPSGLYDKIIMLREKNRKRIIEIIIQKIDCGKINDSIYNFKPNLTHEEKVNTVQQWWNEKTFHLRFAVRSPDALNEMLNFSIDSETMKHLYEAEQKGIPFFINLYYLSLLLPDNDQFEKYTDRAIRDYMIYSKGLVEEFGSIHAWEKEDIVHPNEPNAAGWIIPSQNSIHRRYPDVAILMPETVGRSCGGLCASCQRMYAFQSGQSNFDFNKLHAKKTWPEKLNKLMEYFEFDSQLRDILITGGDPLMSSDKSLEQVLDAVYNMAYRKKMANFERAEGEKYAEILRVRIGTRLPIYLPQRITPALIGILKRFKAKASQIGIKQFIIQTHFQTPLEITPESQHAIEGLISAGWLIANQSVFTVGASRRGHVAKLRKMLNNIGVLTYYTFSVKGYMENQYNFTPNARTVHEMIEEKRYGIVPDELKQELFNLTTDPENITRNIRLLREKAKLPFLATDRNILNLPGVGKSMSFHVIGITNDGRRILEFNHDKTRRHSPIIEKMGKIIIIESKSIGEYLEQLLELGEKIEDYESIYGYSIGETEPVTAFYEYPKYDYTVTDEITNLIL
jgi:lysine 2,3-aminomutase